MALEELPALASSMTREGGIAVNLLGPFDARIDLPQIGPVRLHQQTDYPFHGSIAIAVSASSDVPFAIEVRIPDWAEGATLRVGDDVLGANAGSYARVARRWQDGDTILLDLPLDPVAHRATNRNVQASITPDGEAIAQEVQRHDYLALTLGPLVYATSLIDDFKVEESLRFADGEVRIDPVPAMQGTSGDNLLLHAEGRPALPFQPYYRAGGRSNGAWRLTWMRLAPE